MGIFELYSKRQIVAARSGQADVYQYEIIPAPLRVQVEQIALDGIGFVGTQGDGGLRGAADNSLWVDIEKVYLREKGVDGISRNQFAGDRILTFMRECSTADWLDLLELVALSIKVMGRDGNDYARDQWVVQVSSDKAIEEINYRLREAGVGYQVEAEGIMRVDSQFVHSEVVKPVLALLSVEGFEGPQQEFLSAHQHYRAGEHRQAVAMAANALESTLKAVFDQKGWEYKPGARISDLLKVARANTLWPDYLDNSFDQLAATLQSGLPKIRDNDASHGQGAKAKPVPSYIAAYALHLAASKIVFIVEAAK